MIKKYFVPNNKNDHRPHILRGKALAVFVLAAFVVEIAFVASIFFAPASNFIASVLPGVLISLTNENRLTQHVNLLEENELLTQAAQLKANDMAAKSYFSHTSPDGREPWYWLDTVGYNYLYAGENLAVNFVDSTEVTNAWMNSPSHRANMVSGNYTQIGIAVASGVYKGRNTMYVVQFFGRPKITVAPVTPGAQPVTQSMALQQIAPASAPTAPASIPKSASAFTQPKPNVAQNVASAASAPGAIPNPVVEPVVDSETLTAEASVPAQQLKVTEKITEQVAKSAQRMSTEPKMLASYILGTLTGLLVVALMLAVFIKIRIQRPQMIAAALVVIAIISLTMYINTSVITRNGEVPTSQTAAVINSF